MDSIYHTVRLLAALWLVMVVFLFGLGGNKSSDERWSTLFLFATLSAFLPTIQYSATLLASGEGTIPWGFPFLSYSGFLLIFLGLLLHGTGILTLRKQWSTVVAFSKDHQLIDRGVYRFIRHPIYAAVLLELLGFGVALSNWIIILLLFIPNGLSFGYRIFVEEKALEGYFGETYIQYEHRTKRLIPGIF
jgi:protein-S-isoprenylcysteine O-methyltransferase Ste14